MLLSVQHGIVSRDQARRLGWSDRQIGHRLKSGWWQRVYPRTFATFSGPLPRDARLWAAVLWAGQGAVLSHQTAAEVQGIIDRPADGSIHLTVPARRRPAQLGTVRGVAVHRRDRSNDELAGPFRLPRTSIEDTVLDLATGAPTFDLAYSWISRAVSRQLVTPGPRSRLQAGRVLNGRTHYRDSWYAEYRVAVEIDGPVAVTLQRNGWTGRPRACRRAGCAVRGHSSQRG